MFSAFLYRGLSLIARHQRTIVNDLIDTAKSSPCGHDDDDADHNLPDATAPEASAAPVSKRSSGFFADEDDLMSDSQVSFPYVLFRIFSNL
jgi:hypothetical protein